MSSHVALLERSSHALSSGSSVGLSCLVFSLSSEQCDGVRTFLGITQCRRRISSSPDCTQDDERLTWVELKIPKTL